MVNKVVFPLPLLKILSNGRFTSWNNHIQLIICGSQGLPHPHISLPWLGCPFSSSLLPAFTWKTPAYFLGLNLRTVFLGTLCLITSHLPWRFTVLSLSILHQSTGYSFYICISLSFFTLVCTLHIPCSFVLVIIISPGNRRVPSRW